MSSHDDRQPSEDPKAEDAPSTGVRLGTRGSKLARWQAEWVSARLRERGVPVELVILQTHGDVKAGPLGAAANQGWFTRAIQQALLEDRVDVAVHSLKDLPTDGVPGLCLAAVPSRERPGDGLVTREGWAVEDLPPGARVATGSVRRKAMLLHARSDLVVDPVRGNVDTRLRRLHEGAFDAMVLAQAGLRRLGLWDKSTQELPLPPFLPAPGQGALGLETRDSDDRVRQLLARLEDSHSRASVDAERQMLADLRAGCLAPVGAWARVEDGVLHLSGCVLAADGSARLDVEVSGPAAAATDMGRAAAERLLEQGAAELIAESREANE